MTVHQGVTCHRQRGDAQRFRDLGLWGDLTLAEIVAQRARQTPNKLAVVDGKVSWTYAQLVDRSLRAATLLREFGVEPGDRVVAQVPSCAVLPLVHLAANWIGALFVPTSDSWRQAEMAALLGTSDARVLIYATNKDFDLDAMYDDLRGSLPGLAHVIPARTGEQDTFEELLAVREPLSEADRARLRPNPDEPAHVMVSSGTTGIPKASAWGGNDVLTLLMHHFKDAFDLSENDIAAGIAPANVGSTGYVFPVLAPLLIGASSRILEKWSPKAALDLMESHHCTFATAIPTQMTLLLSEPTLDATDLSAFTRFNNAGAPLPVKVAEEIETRMGCRVQSAYGASDGGLPTLTSIHDPDEPRRASVGRSPLGQELELRDPLGVPVPHGEEGEVFWRGANKSYGYVNQPDYETAVWADGGWYRSGDLGRIDDQGYLRITGRSKDMILRGGTNIFPREIEELLAQHPDITAASVLPVPHDVLGEQACAAVIQTEGTTPLTVADLSTFLSERGVAKFKHPEHVFHLSEFPMNAGGKIDRATLRVKAVDVVAGDSITTV